MTGNKHTLYLIIFVTSILSAFGNMVNIIEDLPYRDSTIVPTSIRYSALGNDRKKFEINSLLSLRMERTLYFEIEAKVFDHRSSVYDNLDNDQYDIEFLAYFDSKQDFEFNFNDFQNMKFITSAHSTFRSIDGKLRGQVNFPLLFKNLYRAYTRLTLLVRISPKNQNPNKFLNSGFFIGNLELQKRNFKPSEIYNLNYENGLLAYRNLQDIFNRLDFYETQNKLPQRDNLNTFGEEVFNLATDNIYPEVSLDDFVINKKDFERLKNSPNDKRLISELCSYFYEDISNLREKLGHKQSLGIIHGIGDQINRPLVKQCLKNPDAFIKVTPMDFISRIHQNSITLKEANIENYLLDADYLVYRQTRIAKEYQRIWHNAVIVKAGATVPLIEVATAEVKTEYERTEASRNMDAVGENMFISFRQRKEVLAEKIKLEFLATFKNCLLIQDIFIPKDQWQEQQILKDKKRRVCLSQHGHKTITESWFFIREKNHPDMFISEGPFTGRLIKSIRGEKNYSHFVQNFRDKIQKIHLVKVKPEPNEFTEDLQEIIQSYDLPNNVEILRDGQFPGVYSN